MVLHGLNSSKQVLMCLGQTHNADGGIPGSSLVSSQALYDKSTVPLHEMLSAVLLLQLIKKGWLSVTGKILTIMYM